MAAPQENLYVMLDLPDACAQILLRFSTNPSEYTGFTAVSSLREAILKRCDLTSYVIRDARGRTRHGVELVDVNLDASIAELSAATFGVFQHDPIDVRCDFAPGCTFLPNSPKTG